MYWRDKKYYSTAIRVRIFCVIFFFFFVGSMRKGCGLLFSRHRHIAVTLDVIFLILIIQLCCLWIFAETSNYPTRGSGVIESVSFCDLCDLLKCQTIMSHRLHCHSADNVSVNWQLQFTPPAKWLRSTVHQTVHSWPQFIRFYSGIWIFTSTFYGATIVVIKRAHVIGKGTQISRSPVPNDLYYNIVCHIL